jgi:hypothetical protein
VHQVEGANAHVAAGSAGAEAGSLRGQAHGSDQVAGLARQCAVAHAEEQADVIDALRQDSAHGAGDDVGLHPNVTVGEEQPLAHGALSADVEGMALTQPAIRQCVHARDLQSRVRSRDAVEDLDRLVGRAVIDRDHFQIDALLG